MSSNQSKCIFIAGLVLLIAFMANAQSTQIPLQARLVLRPLTPGEISTNKLPSTTEVSGGLPNIGLGQPAYLQLEINSAVPASDITGVTFTVTSRPGGSTSALTDSPLTAALGVFEPSERASYQVAGRTLFRPDMEGEFVVSATVTTKTNGTATVAQTVFGATYVGIGTCSKCHSGGPDMLNNINGVGETSYPTTCYGCHTVGYDLNDKLNNGGFDKVAAKLGWTPPAKLDPSNFDNLPADLKNLANIQCENCHGPGSIHAASGGTPFEITAATSTGACQQCHDAPTHHVKGTEWKNSMHSVTTTDPATMAACVGCHTSAGFIERTKGLTTLTARPNDSVDSRASVAH
jgi:hypothetical protein